MINYFIHYTLIKNGKIGDGNVDVKVDALISSIDQIRQLEEGLKEHNGADSLVINNYIVLEDSIS